ncbi:plant virulence effector HPE1-like domain-containing protein [Rhizobium sullae]|uniref:Plant virulence effector HPE1-like domain-containing protein n=1 Tax=Rhizobium sullae TaxID=50338 RepID=A0A2N0D1Y4_RHISU|nr:plant virulence effector HPE1-like domain-containing protein [Rhizobium sullae]PKA40109.1 hypothetical protein CWR43_26160 [Rhizobium sullae]TCU19059.1 hypothetical protein EV132_102288 [Rhizobium sullae]UWU14901.1 plant virulence effector HPE1-like domain-containing protein [Rhizobium sullae]
MRQFILGAAILLAAGSAMASSIEVIGKTPRTGGESIVTETCASCPPLQSTERKKDYTVPALPPGAIQESALRDVAGEPKLYRTEGWMGGSPVVFVTKATPEVIAAFKETVPAEGIDPTATTSVIGGDAKPVVAGMSVSMEQTAPLDVSGFKLRM